MSEKNQEPERRMHPGYAWVVSGLTGADRDKVVLSEVDPDHPVNAEGKREVWVAGADSPAVKAAKTPEVVRHLREGELREVGEPEAARVAGRTAQAAPLTDDERAELEALRAKSRDADAALPKVEAQPAPEKPEAAAQPPKK